MSGVAAQWSLDSTSASALTIGRGLLAASTSDNVQPIALLACESFGSTLAMSPETIAKVERVIVPSPPPAVLQFLQAQVGFFKDDSASFFGRSAAGVRFLGLAAALVSIVPLDNGVNALDMMLRKNKADLTLLPTLRQLHAMLFALSPRCFRGDFASSLVGCGLMLRPLKEGLAGREYHASILRHFDDAPTPDMLEQLVDVFRQIARIGESTVLGATIKIRKALVWVVAFSRWCLGCLPRVFLSEDSGANILPDDPQSRITIVACDASLGKDIEVTIHDGLGTRLNRLIAPDLSGGMLGSDWASWDGMVSVPEYGAWRLHQLQIEHHLSDLSDLTDYIAHAVPLVGQLFQADALKPQKTPPQMTAHRCNPFRDYRGFDEAYEILFQKTPPEWRPPDTYRKFGIWEMLASLRGPQSFWARARGRGTWAIQSLVDLILDLVVISMLVSPKTARCRLGYRKTEAFDVDESSSEYNTVQTLQHCCYKLLSGGSDDRSRLKSLPIQDILHWAALLFGRESYSSAYVLSSNRGQTMYIEAYESLTVRAIGYLRLCLLPGVIRYKNETYWVLHESPCPPAPPPAPWPVATSTNLSDATAQHNQYRGYSVQWVITLSGISSLRAIPHMVFDRGGISTQASPSQAMRSMASTVMAVSCEHATGPTDTAFASRENVPVAFIGMERNKVPFGAVGVVAVSGSQDLRFLAAGRHWYEESEKSSGRGIVIRQDACFDCCIQLCVLNDIRILIL